jgi:hypothetical protein
MTNHVFFIRLTHLVTAKTWLLIAVLSLVLAVSSAMFLTVASGVKLSGPLASLYDGVELFLRDTVRLTFKTGRSKKQVTETVYMAPPGILDEKKTFTWLDFDKVMAEAKSNQATPSVGVVTVRSPSRILDPTWQPNFNRD